MLSETRMPVLADALEEAGCTDETLLMHLRGKERCPRCAAHPFEPGYVEMYGMFHEPGDAPFDVICPDCAGTGWRPATVPCVRGFFVLDLILGKE